jgi:hypothetical protein
LVRTPILIVWPVAPKRCPASGPTILKSLETGTIATGCLIP